MPTPCTKQSFQKSVVSVEVIGHCAMPNCGAHRRVHHAQSRPHAHAARTGGSLPAEQRREARAHLLHVHQRGAGGLAGDRGEQGGSHHRCLSVE